MIAKETVKVIDMALDSPNPEKKKENIRKEKVKTKKIKQKSFIVAK